MLDGTSVETSVKRKAVLESDRLASVERFTIEYKSLSYY